MAPQLHERHYEFDLFRIDIGRRLLLSQGKVIPLTPKAFDILLILVQNRDRIMGKDELMRLAWPDTAVEENNLTRNISSLRRALGERPDEHRYIVTVPGRGYGFAAEIPNASDGEVVLERHARARVLIEEQSETDPSILPVAPRVVERRSWHRIAIQVTLSTIACATLFCLAWLYLSRRKEGVFPPPRIVPLTSLPDRAECASFSADGSRVAFSRHSDSPQLSGIYIKQIGNDSYLQVTRSASDYCPVWSPDGSYLAFSRYGYQEHSVYLVSVIGNEERKLYSGAPSHQPLAWSPDGQFIAFSAANPEPGSYSILSLQIATLETHKLTQPPPGFQDWGPAFSPDGRRLAFIRTNGKLTTGEIFLTNASGGSAHRLTFDNVAILSSPAWMPDGKSVVFSSKRSGLPTLWRIPVSGGSATQIAQAGVKAVRPAISPSGNRLAFDQPMSNSSLWSLSLDNLSQKYVRRQVTASKGHNGAAEFSPDGSRVALVSDRSGSDAIYICSADGSNLLQLTNLGNQGATGFPRWSPDGQKIAFDSALQERTVILAISANGGKPRVLTDNAFDNLNPSWSHDGRWIYFTSSRTGQWQIWKMPSEGGEALQLTRQGGFIGFESSDRRFLYFAKTATDPEIWKLRLEDREESPVSPRIHVSQWTSWALVDNGIFFVQEAADAHPVLRYLDLASGHVKDVTALDKQPWPLWISASADRKFVLYQQVDMLISNVMLMENFR